MTAALLGQRTHRALFLEFLGKPYRFRQRMQREKGIGGHAVDGPALSAPPAAPAT